jgi:hypothetical protein
VRDPSTGTPALAPQAKLPSGPPHPALQASGFNGSIHDFNDRVQAVTDAYKTAYGVKPSPGLAFDVVRSPLAPDQFPHLFTVPQSARQMRARAVAPDAPPPILTNKDLYDGAINAAKTGGLHDYLDQHGNDLYKLLGKNPALAARYQKTLADTRKQQNPALIGKSPGRTEADVTGAGLAGKILFGVVMGFGQFAGSTAIGPAALGYAEAKATKQSVEQKSLRPLAKTQVEIAKGIAAGVAQDVRHPQQNAGFLAADIFAAATGGAGLFSRLGRAGTALKEAGAGAAVKAAATRRVPGTVEVRRGGATEHELVSENPLVGAIQEHVIAPSRNRNLERRYTAEDAPAGVKAVLQPSRLVDAVVDLFPAESKIGRLSLARRRVEQAVSDVPLRQLEHVAKATNVELTFRQFVADRTGRLPDQVSSRAFLPQTLRRGLTAGEQKAIQVLATDDPHPWQAWKDFHEYMIETLPKDAPAVSAHRAQLAALKLARKEIDNPSPRLQKAMALADELYARQQNIKIEELGLSPATAEQHVADIGEVVRGRKALADTGALQAKVTSLEKQIARTPSFHLRDLPQRLDEAKAELADALDARSQPRRTTTSRYQTLRASPVHQEAGQDRAAAHRRQPRRPVRVRAATQRPDPHPRLHRQKHPRRRLPHRRNQPRRRNLRARDAPRRQAP